MSIKKFGLNIINWIKKIYSNYFIKEDNIITTRIIITEITPVFSPIFNQIVKRERINVDE